MTEVKKYQIELRYDRDALAEDIEALAHELRNRGHEVDVRRSGRSGIVSDLARSAVDLKEIAENVRGVAENGMQKIRDVISPFVKNSDSKETNGNKKKEETSEKNDGFDDIGPDAASGSGTAPTDRAVVVTSPECLEEAPWDALRIGMIPKTVLDRAWQPGSMDAVIIPHPSFQPYFDSIHWAPERVFKGGYLARTEDFPSMGHEDAMKHFNLRHEDGPVVVVMASGFLQNNMHTIMVQMSLLQKPVQIFFYHAGNRALADALRSLAQRFGVKARMFGRVDNLCDYLAIADIAVVDAEDDNIELLENAGVPLVAVPHREPSPIVNFLVHERSTVIAQQLHQLSSIMNPIILNAASMSAMHTDAADIASYGSVRLCADAVEAVLGAAETILPEPEKRAPVHDGFEDIGQGGNLGFDNAFSVPASPVVNTVQPVGVPMTPVQPVGVPMTPVQPVAAPMTPILTPTITAPVPQAPILTPVLNARSREEIQQEYTQLILSEKSIDKAMDMASSEVRQWEQRLDLARQNQRDDLVNSAIIRLNAAKTEEVSLMRQKEEIQNQKNMLKQAARASAVAQAASSTPFALSIENDLFATENDPLEAEFKKLQSEEALRDLHRKLGK